MRLGIDLDDTMTNSSDVFIKYARIYNKEKFIEHEVNINELDQTVAFGWNDNDKKEFRKKFLEKILIEAIPNKNVANVLKKIHNNGNKIIIITARSNSEVAHIEELTKKWLLKNNIEYDELLTDCKNKAEICFKYNIDVFVDDSVKNCVSVYEKLKIPVFLFSTRYNQNSKLNGVYRVHNWDELSKKTVINNPLKYFDVDEKCDFPPIIGDNRYIHFYGGTKNYRAYVAPSNISRADFMELYPEYVPVQNQPIYENNGIIVRADPKYPCPGFYIFALNKTYRAFDLLDDITFMRFCLILKKIKQGMRSKLNINYAHLLSNEKSDSFVNVHFWLVPIDGTTSPDLLDFDVKSYLESFKPGGELQKVLDYNKRLKEYIDDINLVKQDNDLTEKLS